jgi:hypothetical protein
MAGDFMINMQTILHPLPDEATYTCHQEVIAQRTRRHHLEREQRDSMALAASELREAIGRTP